MKSAQWELDQSGDGASQTAAETVAYETPEGQGLTLVTDSDADAVTDPAAPDIEPVSEPESDPAGDTVSGTDTAAAPADVIVTETVPVIVFDPAQAAVVYRFRNNRNLQSHYEKHGIEMGFASAEEYEAAASAVINNPAALTKTEKEDGDYVYYLEETNEFVILSTDGYIRTYFLPSAGKAYYDRQ
jgi:pyocin large subunit-like protein